MPPGDVERRPVADYVKLPEVARRLDVSEKTARRMVKSGKLPAVFVGGAYRVSEEDLAEYLEGARVDLSGKAPTSSQPDFNGLLEEEHRRAVLAEIRESYSETREGLEHYCDTWEQRIAAGDLDWLAVQGFLEAGDPLLPAMTDAVVSELIEISRVVSATEDGRVSKEMLAEASLKPAVDRYHTIGRKLQVMWQERFAETQPAEAAGDNKVADFLAYKDAKLQAVVSRRAASG